MLRLTGGDACFLYRETPSTPQHTLKISILNPGEMPVSREALKSHFEAVVHRIPALRWRILPTPLGIHHPVAVEDPEFDMEFHVRHVALPAPGTMRELEEMIGQIASHALDRDRPLWEMWLVEGLEHGHIACIMKAHHAIADGSASVHLFTRTITSLDPDEVPPVWSPPPLPGPARLFWDAVVDHVKYDAVGFPDFLRAVVSRLRDLRKHRKTASYLAVDPLNDKIPPSHFNGALTTHRKFATLSLALTDARNWKGALGGTINDVVLALVGGGLRRYLQFHNLPTDSPLITIIPVSADEPGTIRVFGNNISMMGSRLYVNIADPEERYNAIRQATLGGKRELEIVGKSTLPAITHYLLPFLMSIPAQRAYRNRLADRSSFAFPCQVAVSNVPGPRTPLESEGATLEALYSVGPLQEGNGLNITVWSYCEQLNFGIITCKKIVPDPERVAACIRAEAESLAELAAGKVTNPASGR